MPSQFISILTCVLLICALSIIFSCEKEHLQPNIPGEPDPVVYVLARLGNDSIRIAGGLDGYIGSTAVKDTLGFREFKFILANPHHPFNSSLHISINNHQNIMGDLQADLDHSVYTGTRHFQDSGHFIPLAATVVWYNANGIKFTTRTLMQPHPFSILDVEDVDFEGKTYKKTTVEFDSTLSDGHGHVLHLTNTRATILFGVN